MPFTKTHQPFEQFLREFTGKSVLKTIAGNGSGTHPMIPVSLFTGESVDFLVRYYKRSGSSSVEDLREYYPCVVIQDFIPEIDKKQIWGKNFVEGVFDSITKVRDYITLPVPMIYRFQVSAVTKRQRQASGINDWFMEHFISGTPQFFEFNKIQTDSGFVADITPYTVVVSDVPREDGRFEYVYDFTVNTYIHARSKPIFVGANGNLSGGNFKDTLEKLNIVINLGDYNQVRSILAGNFEPLAISEDQLDTWGSIKW